MSAAAIPYTQTQKSFSFKFLLFAGLLLLAAMLYGTHAIERHGEDALAVRECVERGGGIELWYNPETMRQAEVCLMPDGKFGVQVSRFNREVTSFVKDKLQRIDQVHVYLRNRGYELIYRAH